MRYYLRTEKWTLLSCQIKLNLEFNYTFPFDLEPNGILFDSNSTEKECNNISDFV